MTQIPLRPEPRVAAAPAGSPTSPPRRKTNWWVIGGFIGVGTLLMLYIEIFKPFGGAQPLTGGPSHFSVGKKVSRLALEGLSDDAEPQSLDALKGNVIVLNFWGTWCESCRGELPFLARLNRQWQNDRVKVFAVACSNDPQNENKERLKLEAEKFLKDFSQEPVPLYFDADHATRDHLTELGAFDESYPRTVVIGTDGSILAVWKGYNRVKSPKEIGELLVRVLQQ